MLGVPQITNELVVIAVHPTDIVCIWIQQKNTLPFIVAAYKRYQCTHFQVGRGILFNLTWIQKSIIHFLKQYVLLQAYIAFLPDFSSVTHDFVVLDTAYPEQKAFDVFQVPHNDFGFDYLYADATDRHLFYWYRISRPLIMQYKCIIMPAQLNCIRITPRFSALLHAYRAVNGKAFRRAQLGIDLMKTNNHISRYFSIDTIHRLVKIPDKTSIDFNVMIDIVAACGIAYLQKESV